MGGCVRHFSSFDSARTLRLECDASSATSVSGLGFGSPRDPGWVVSQPSRPLSKLPKPLKDSGIGFVPTMSWVGP